MLVEEKTLNRERTNMKLIQEKAMVNHSCTAKLVKKILRRIIRILSRLDGLLLMYQYTLRRSSKVTK